MFSKFILVGALVASTSVLSNAAWKVQASGTMAWLNAIHFADERHGWIVGSKGALLTTIDAGATWKPAKRFTNDAIRDVYFADRLQGWLLCERPLFGGSNEPRDYLLSTTDGGQSWQKHEPFRTGDRVIRFFFRNSESGCAIGEGGHMSCTYDRGAKWANRELPVRYLMVDGSFLEDKGLILVGGGGSVLRSDDGGHSWMSTASSENQSKLNSLHISGSKTGWAVGARGRIIYTEDGGRSWKQQASPTSTDLRGVYFSDSNTGYAVGDEGVILRTVDGRNWTREISPTAHRLEALAASSERVIAVGFGGTILVSELGSGPGGTK